ncbi:MAG: amidohydrolase [Paracoccaceae bacterium]|jgi:amidohydrolase
MPVLNRIADLHPALTAIRRDLHMHPELDFDVHRTAAIVAAKLREFGCDEVHEGIGRTGVVGVIRGRSTGSGKVIAMRADMDALPIEEITGAEYASTIPGKMHACGHDGHTAMLLGAAQILAETRNFDGTAIVIFQPAEEGGGGGREMVAEGMLDRFGVQQVFGMHNMPGIPVGEFAMCKGPIMAAADHFDIKVEGRGAHAARPHDGIDTGLVAAHIMLAAQSLVSRNVDPLDNAVVTIASVHTETTAYNVIPQVVRMRGTARTLSPAVQDMIEERLPILAQRTAEAYGATAEVIYRRNYPVTVNSDDAVLFAGDVARDVAGAGAVNETVAPMMAAEDFSFMLNERPGAYIFVGNGDTAGVHHPAYDFDDAAIPFGTSYWVRLAEMGMRSS